MVDAIWLSFDFQGFSDMEEGDDMEGQPHPPVLVRQPVASTGKASSMKKVLIRLCVSERSIVVRPFPELASKSNFRR